MDYWYQFRFRPPWFYTTVNTTVGKQAAPVLVDKWCERVVPTSETKVGIAGIFSKERWQASLSPGLVGVKQISPLIEAQY